MARTKAVKEGQFLIVSHEGQGYRAYGGTINGENAEIVLRPAVEAAIDEGWLNIPAFMRDVQAGLLHLRRSDEVPVGSLPEIDPEFELTDTQKYNVWQVCRCDPILPQYLEIITLHDQLGKGGIQRDDSTVSKSYLKKTHYAFLQAALDLERRHKNRSDVINLLANTIKQVEAL